MNEKLSKYKGIVYLVVLLIILPVAIYMLALGKTLNIYIANNKASSEIEKLEAAKVTEKIPEVPVTSQDYISNGLILDYIKNNSTTQDGNIVIDKFIPSKIDLGNGISVHTAQIVIYSDYISIVKTIDNLEKTANQCNLVSVNFKSETNRQTNNVKLKATIIIQQILEQ